MEHFKELLQRDNLFCVRTMIIYIPLLILHAQN